MGFVEQGAGVWPVPSEEIVMGTAGATGLVLQVEGMDCGACERRLRTVLGRLDGVGHVDADHVTGRVRLRFDATRTTAEELTGQATGRIEACGFGVPGGQEREASS